MAAKVTEVKNMTEGNPSRLLLMFALPLLAGNICQRLYTMVDAVIVGRGVGVEALSALGSADWYVWLILGLVQGFAEGFAILLAQRFGAGDDDGVRRVAGTSAVLMAFIAVAATIISQVTVAPVLQYLRVEPEVAVYAKPYLRILFIGTPVVAAYNLSACILKALGNGKAPLWAMVIASALNVALDWLFVMVFHWGVEGAAAATVIAQAVSFLYCLVALLKLPLLKLTREEWRPERETASGLMRLGFPLCFQNAIISIGGLVLTSVVNGFGYLFMAGYTATNKFFFILEVVAISMAYAVTTFVGQNLGAGRIDRVEQGMRSAFWMITGAGVLGSTAMVLFGRFFIRLFLSGDIQKMETVVDTGYRYMCFLAAGMLLLYWLHIYRYALQGIGNTVVPMWSGVAELVMRVGCALVLTRFIGEDGIFIAELAAWFGAAAVLMTAFYRRLAWLKQKAAAAPPPAEV